MRFSAIDVTKFFLCIWMLFVAVLPVVAQSDEMTAQATPANIQAWLHSKDPRLIAWGAHFARENNDTDALAAAADIIKQSLNQGGLDLQASYGPQHDALAVILDAVIQRNVTVSADHLNYLKQTFPEQSAILASRLSTTETSAMLMDWYATTSQHPYEMSRIAAMLLSKAPSAGFAASILAAPEETLMVTVIASDHGIGLGSGYSTGCADGVGAGPKNGWPPIYWYQFQENNNGRADPILVEAGGDRITWQRLPANGGWGSCYYVKPLYAETRHHLLAEMLGRKDSDMSWPTQQNVSIIWTNKEQFDRDLGGAIETEDERLRESVKEFRSRSLISQEEASSVRPKLSVLTYYSPALHR
jgi:hypothetical protein